MWCVLLMTVCGLQQPHLVLRAQHSWGNHDLSIVTVLGLVGGRRDLKRRRGPSFTLHHPPRNSHSLFESNPKR